MYLARSGSPGRSTASAYSPGSARTWIGMRARLYRRLRRVTLVVRADARAGARVLRARADRARLPRGRRAARARPVRRRRGGRRHARGALPHRREPRPVGRRAAAVFARRGGGGALAHDHRRGRRGDGALGRGARRAAGAARGPPGSAGLRDRRAARSRARPGCARRRPPTSTGSCRRAPPRTSSSSASIRSRATRTAFRWRTSAQIDEGRSWLWLEDGVVLFKAEASAWTPHAVQIQQVWVDPAARGRGYALARPARPLPAAARDARRP